MGSSESKPNVDELMDKIDAGDEDAIGELWGLLDRDGAGTLEGDESKRCFREVSEELLEGWEGMDATKRDRLAKVMIPLFVKAKLDPNHDGVITKEEFTARIVTLLNVDE